MVGVREVVRYQDEPDAIYIVLTADDGFQHRVKVTRESNPAMYYFLDEHGAVATDPRPNPDTD